MCARYFETLHNQNLFYSASHQSVWLGIECGLDCISFRISKALLGQLLLSQYYCGGEVESMLISVLCRWPTSSRKLIGSRLSPVVWNVTMMYPVGPTSLIMLGYVPNSFSLAIYNLLFWDLKKCGCGWFLPPIFSASYFWNSCNSNADSPWLLLQFLFFNISLSCQVFHFRYCIFFEVFIFSFM